jgi:hypothetical protein
MYVWWCVCVCVCVWCIYFAGLDFIHTHIHNISYTYAKSTRVWVPYFPVWPRVRAPFCPTYIRKCKQRCIHTYIHSIHTYIHTYTAYLHTYIQYKIMRQRHGTRVGICISYHILCHRNRLVGIGTSYHIISCAIGTGMWTSASA